jgi:O-antigen/teichoic acid export membrane protein
MFKDLAKSILIYGLASSIGKFVGLFLVPIYTRIFTPEQYGVIDLVSTVVAFVSILGMVQLESSISRYYYTAKDEQERRLYVSTAFWAVVGLSIFWMCITFMLAGNLSLLLFKTSQYRNIIIVASLIVPTSNLFSLLTVVMRYVKKPVVYTVFVTLQLLSAVGISVWLVVFLRVGIVGVFYGQLSGFIVGGVAQLFYLHFLLTFTLNWDVLKKFFRYGLPMVPSVAGNWLNAYANRFVMVGYLSLADIGLYTVALKIASVFHLIESAFRMAWGPFMWENFHREDHREIYKLIMKIVTTGVFFLIIAFSMFGKEALTLLASLKYVKASHLIGMLAFSTGLTIVYQTIGLGAGITKRTEFNTIIYLLSVCANLACLFILVPKMGLIAVPVSLLMGSTTMVVLGWYNSERLYYIGFSKSFFAMGYLITLVSVAMTVSVNLHIFFKLVMIIVVSLLFMGMLLTGREPILRLGSKPSLGGIGIQSLAQRLTVLKK